MYPVEYVVGKVPAPYNYYYCTGAGTTKQQSRKGYKAQKPYKKTTIQHKTATY
jgi:hypothetical protein